MKPKVKLAEAQLPKGGVMALYAHDGSYSISFDGQELMHSDACASECLMGDLGVERLGDVADARVLIGGLGLGFTLRKVIAVLGPEAHIEVAELVPEVIEWNQSHLSELNGELLSVAGVEVKVADVCELIRNADRVYDSIIIDVDNGPFAMVADSNASLYSLTGLRRIWAALKPQGRVVFWSAKPDIAFEQKLKRIGFAVKKVPAKVHERAKRAAYMLYVADRD
jgi:spermidine synthase